MEIEIDRLDVRRLIEGGSGEFIRRYNADKVMRCL